ncbi:hypothetical protein, partial [Staphylococcus aureus]
RVDPHEVLPYLTAGRNMCITYHHQYECHEHNNIISITNTINIASLTKAMIQARKLEGRKNLKKIPSRQAFSQSNACFQMRDSQGTPTDPNPTPES